MVPPGAADRHLDGARAGRLVARGGRGPARARPRRRATPSSRARRSRQICRSPVFRAAAASRTAATVQPARLAFGLRAALLRRGVRIHEDTEVTAIDARGAGARVRTMAGGERGYVRRPRGRARGRLADAALAGLRARADGRVEPHRPDRAGARRARARSAGRAARRSPTAGGCCTTSARRPTGGSRSAGAAGAWPTTRAPTRGSTSTPRSSSAPRPRCAASSRCSQDRAITHAWGGPIDVAPQPPADLPLARRRVHAGWGFTGHGVGPSHLGGRILSGLALGVRDEVTTLPLVEPPVEVASRPSPRAGSAAR